MAPRLKLTLVNFLAAALVMALPLLLSSPAQAQNALSMLAGSWAGGGTIVLSNGSRERISCRANYAVPGATLQLALRCASDSYTFDFRAYGTLQGNNISGNWDESTRHAAGTFSGVVNGHQIDARTEGQTFSALLTLTTRGSRQTISIRSPGSTLSEATIVLSRR
jgi:hypothetical protein